MCHKFRLLNFGFNLLNAVEFEKCIKLWYQNENSLFTFRQSELMGEFSGFYQEKSVDFKEKVCKSFKFPWKNLSKNCHDNLKRRFVKLLIF